MSFDMSNYYATNTDVWVFGTPPQYSAFARSLTAHRGPIRIPADERGGMDLLILAPAQHVAREFVVLHERLVHQNGRFNMELIVGGSDAGFRFVASAFRRLARRGAGDPDAHIHIDSDDDLLILPSVFLNIRGSVADIDSRLAELAPPGPHDLLPDMEWRDPDLWRYEPLDGYSDLYGRIPLASDGEPEGGSARRKPIVPK